MCRLLAALAAGLLAAVPAQAQYAQTGNNPYTTDQQSSSPYPGMPINPYDYGQIIERLPQPWVPPVPPVTPKDYARQPSTQAALNYAMGMYGGYGGGYGGGYS